MYEVELVEVSNEDLQLFEQIYMNPNMLDYIGEPLTKQEVLEAHKNSLIAHSEKGPINKYFVISLIELKVSVGIVGVSAMMENVSVGELGVMVLPEWQGNKIALNAFKILKTQVQIKGWYSSLVAHIDQENLAANSVFIKLGYNLTNSTYIEKYNKKMNKWEKNIDGLN